MAFALPSDMFSLAYEPRTDILRGSWAGPQPASALPGCYVQLLAAAHAHGRCRFWLLDLQARNWSDDSFARWFAAQFIPQVLSTLSQPVFIACIVQPEQRAHVENDRTELLLRQVADCNVYPFYFVTEADARAWLADQQAGEQPALEAQSRGERLLR